MRTQKITKRVGLMGLAAVLAATPVSAFLGEHVSAASESWGPQDRATFTWESPATYPTFNSITNNPTLGDERNFVRVKEVGADGAHYDTVDVEAGKEYEVYVYFHNNASASLNASGQGIADNVRLATKLPEKIEAGQVGVVTGTISSTNTNPTSVFDTAYLNAKETVYLRYVWDSATIHNGGSANGSILDAEALFSEQGAKLAYWADTWGVIPGCNEYAGYVTYRVVADQPKFSVNKEVSAERADNYADNIATTPGATLDFKITYKNTGTTKQNSVTMYDVMPEGMSYVAGSTYIRTTADQNGHFLEDKLFDGGIVIGDFAAGEEAVVTYKATISDDVSKFACGSTTLYNNSSTATANGTITDKARIVVTRTCAASELPETGPGEVALAVMIVLAIGGGGFYFYKSRKMLKQVSTAAGVSEDIVRDGIQNNPEA